MTFEDALKHYQTGKALAKALGVSKGRISQCKANGGFSYQMQCVLEKDSRGALVASRAHEPSSTSTQVA